MYKKLWLSGVTIALLLILVGGISQAQETPTPTPVPRHHVVILVVDDFSARSYSEIVDLLFPDQTQQQQEQRPPIDELTLCYFNPLALVEGQAMADGMGGAARDADGNLISHGDLVMAQTVEMLDSVPNPYSDVVVTVVPVHVERYVVSDISAAIEQTMNELTSLLGDTGQVDFVINMSFALVPCHLYQSLESLVDDLMNSLSQAQWDNFRAALADIISQIEAETNGFVNRPDYACEIEPIDEQIPSEESPEATESPEETDSPTPEPDLNDTCGFREIFYRSNVIAVASSGNFGLDFPTWPAAWEGVISVSAGPECSGFDSEGGSDNRLISQRLTLPENEPLPWCTPNEQMALRMDMIRTNIAAGQIEAVFISSKGEVMMPGIWDYGTGLNDAQSRLSGGGAKGFFDPEGLFYDSTNQLMAFVGRTSNRNFKPDGFISGTSFAAPRMSFAMAMYLADAFQNGSTVCRGAPNNTISFAYADPASNPWDGQDWSLADQTNLGQLQFCPDFYTTSVPGLLNLALR